MDAACGTRFADACRDRVTVSYPPIDTAAFLDLDQGRVDAALARRGLMRNGYVLFLSRVTQAKGVHDLVAAYARSRSRERVKLVVAGAGPALPEIRLAARDDDCVVVLDDVSDEEKPLLMRGCAAYALPTKPEPDFVETFGIALVEKMLAGGGPVITTITGGTGEAVGDTAVIVPAGDVRALADALDHVVLEMTDAERERPRPAGAGVRAAVRARPGVRRPAARGDPATGRGGAARRPGPDADELTRGRSASSRAPEHVPWCLPSPGAPRGAARAGDSGVWRSLVARPLWERKAPGSNPGTPTRAGRARRARARPRVLEEPGQRRRERVHAAVRATMASGLLPRARPPCARVHPDSPRPTLDQTRRSASL